MTDEPGVYPGDPAEPQRRRNARIIAERCHWPAGALERCRQLEEQYEGWHVSWVWANEIKGWEFPAGWYATRSDLLLVGGDELRRAPEDGVRRHLCVFGTDPEALGKRIIAMMERVAEQREREEALWRSMRRGL